MLPEAEDAFDDLRLELAPLDGVAEGRMFHCEGLSYHGKFFAALRAGADRPLASEDARDRAGQAHPHSEALQPATPPQPKPCSPNRAGSGRDGETMLVKLPEDRVSALIADGTGIPFDANKGRPMREWMLVPTASLDRWPAIAHEALTFAQAPLKAKAGRPRAKC